MAVATKKPLTAAEQIDVLRTLKPQAAAFAVGIPMSTLRDRTHLCPPSSDGAYDIQSLVKFATDSAEAIELDDETLERTLRAVETLLFRLTEGNLPAILGVLDAGMADYGLRFGSLFLDELRKCFANYDDGWLTDSTREALAAEMPSDAEILRQFKSDFAKERAEMTLETPSVCDGCGAVRCGRTWRKRKIKATEAPIRAMCPECDE